MQDENEVAETTLETPEEEVEETQDVEVEEPAEEDVEAIKARLAKAEELANNYKTRAEKAEAKAKARKGTEVSTDLSARDLIALSKANIDTEDLDEVLDYASYKKLSIAEALSSSILKATLAEKAELRKSAQAVNTGPTRRANTSVTEDRLLADARSGKMPDRDEDIAKLVAARLSKK